jgi:hypothetical protein
LDHVDNSFARSTSDRISSGSRIRTRRKDKNYEKQDKEIANERLESDGISLLRVEERLAHANSVLL